MQQRDLVRLKKKEKKRKNVIQCTLKKIHITWRFLVILLRAVAVDYYGQGLKRVHRNLWVQSL